MADWLEKFTSPKLRIAKQSSQIKIKSICNMDSSGGRVVRASALGAVDLGLIPTQVKPMTLNLVFTASLLDVQQ